MTCQNENVLAGCFNEQLHETMYPHFFDAMDPVKMTTEEAVNVVRDFFKLNKLAFHPFVYKNGVRYSGVLWITHKMMEIMLKTNISNNRHISPNNWDMIKHDVLLDRWQETTGTQLVFLTSGNLADGQTRLTGMIHSMISGLFLRIGYNHTLEDILNLDNNKNRTTLDRAILSGAHKKSSKNRDTAAKQMIKFIHCYDSNLPPNRYGANDIAVKLSHHEIIEYCRKYNDELDLLHPCFEYGWDFPGIKPGMSAFLGAMYMIARRKYGEQITQLFESIRGMSHLETDDIRVQLRTVMVSGPISNRYELIEYCIFKVVHRFVNHLPMKELLQRHGSQSDPLEICNYRPDYI